MYIYVCVYVIYQYSKTNNSNRIERITRELIIQEKYLQTILQTNYYTMHL